MGMDSDGKMLKHKADYPLSKIVCFMFNLFYT